MNNTIKHVNNDFEVIYNEQCVICKSDTVIPKDMFISLRTNYVEGVGQLCKKCYTTTYNRIEIPIYEQTR